MKVERGGKAIIAIFVGAWFTVWAIMILTEIDMFAFIIGVPSFIALLVVWVFQKTGRENPESEVLPESIPD